LSEPEEFQAKTSREDFDVKSISQNNKVAVQRIKNEENSVNTFDNSNQLDKETRNFIKEKLLYKGFDPEPDKLVQRPEKDVVWGLGGELMKRKLRRFSSF
jgi:hypothetical protein